MLSGKLNKRFYKGVNNDKLKSDSNVTEEDRKENNENKKGNKAKSIYEDPNWLQGAENLLPFSDYIKKRTEATGKFGLMPTIFKTHEKHWPDEVDEPDDTA